MGADILQIQALEAQLADMKRCLAELRGDPAAFPAGRIDPALRFTGGLQTRDIAALELLKTCNHIVVPPALPSVAPGTTSAIQPVQFRTGGKRTSKCLTVEIIGIRGCVVDDTAGSENAGAYERSSMSVQIADARGLDMITNGNSADFVPYEDLFAGAVQFFPCAWELPTSEVLNLSWKNTQPAATGHTLRVAGFTFFCRLPDL